MQLIRRMVVGAIIGLATSGTLAQTATPSPSTSSKIDEVTRWTCEQWNRAKAEWKKEKENWAKCRKQSEDQNLTGEKADRFLMSCMMPATSSKITDVSKWTSEQWNYAKGEWKKEKEKWADCQKQSNDRHLTGRGSWSFLASCMTD